MITVSIILFAIAAALGASLAVSLFKKTDTSKPIVVAHGLAGTLGLIVLAVYVLQNPNPLLTAAITLFIVAAFLLTLLTDHHLGVIRVLPYAFHLAVDAAVGIVFLIAPFAFAFKGIDAWYYWLNGAAAMTVVSLHKPEMISKAAETRLKR